MKKVEEIFKKIYTYFDIGITDCLIDECGAVSVQMALCDDFGVCLCQKHYDELVSLKHARRSQRLLEKPIATVQEVAKSNSYVYLIKDRLTSFIKIGLSTDPQKRLASIMAQKTLLPYENNFSLLIAWEGTQKDETDLHRRFYNQRVRGEWFWLAESDIEYIRREFEGRKHFE